MVYRIYCTRLTALSDAFFTSATLHSRPVSFITLALLAVKHKNRLKTGQRFDGSYNYLRQGEHEMLCRFHILVFKHEENILSIQQVFTFLYVYKNNILRFSLHFRLSSIVTEKRYPIKLLQSTTNFFKWIQSNHLLCENV